MKITCDMLAAATSRAVELGVLPRRAYADDFATNAEIMQEILQAAIDAFDADAISAPELAVDVDLPAAKAA